MTSIKNNKFGNIHALISFLTILSLFMPYAGDSMNDSESAMEVFTFFFVCSHKTHIGAIFVIFVLSQMVNIFVQSKKNISALAFTTGVIGILAILLMHGHIHETEASMNSFNEYNYSSYSYYDNPRYKVEYKFGFYIMIVLIFAQITTQLIAVLKNQNKILIQENQSPTSYTYSQDTYSPVQHIGHEGAVPQSTDNQTKIETAAEEDENEIEEVRAETERLRMECRMLIAQKEELEKTQLENKRAENEKIETERLKAEELEQDRLRQEELEKEIQEKELLEKEYLELKAEVEEYEKQRREKARIEREKWEKEQEELEKERLEKERIEKERLEKERIERERLMGEIAKLKRILNGNDEKSNP